MKIHFLAHFGPISVVRILAVGQSLTGATQPGLLQKLMGFNMSFDMIQYTVGKVCVTFEDLKKLSAWIQSLPMLGKVA